VALSVTAYLTTFRKLHLKQFYNIETRNKTKLINQMLLSSFVSNDRTNVLAYGASS
jgi:hypothetical protein